MIEAGARLALGTDAGVWPRYSFGWADHHELGRYVQLGLTPAQAIVTATCIAAHTERLRVGHLVLCDAFRHPALLAKQAVSIDHASGGRFELGLGWGSQPKDVAGYIGTSAGRSISAPGSWGLERTPESKPKRFSVSYHLLRMAADPARVRVQVWVDDGEPVPSVVSVWPTADWQEREVWDMIGIRFAGHPDLSRILMDDDWEGFPLRKDYPIGGEPVRFSGEE